MSGLPSMKSIARVLPILAVLFGSCQRSGDSTTTPPTHAVNRRDTLGIGDTVDAEYGRVYDATDTTLVFLRGGKKVAVIVPKISVDDFGGFQEYLSLHNPESLSVCLLQFVDVTGDGVNDSCIGRRSMTSNGVVIENRVISQGRLIWYDTLTLEDESIQALNWEGDSQSYRELLPFSRMYAGAGNGVFVGEAVDTASLDFHNFIFFNLDRENYWRLHFGGKRVRFIWNAVVQANEPFVWDDSLGQFVIFWPQ